MSKQAWMPKMSFKDAGTLSAFLRSNSKVRINKGPVGSGKTVACCIEVMRRAFEQRPAPDGYRKFKAAIVRNTYPDLHRSTIETWLSIFPEEKTGKMRMTSPIRHNIKIPPKKWKVGVPAEEQAPDAVPGLDLKVDFVALDKMKDAKSLLSTEYTLIYFNELREMLPDTLRMAVERVGRYPSEEMQGIRASWYGVIGDTNPPNKEHWMYKFEFGEPGADLEDIEDVHGNKIVYEFFNQPPGVIEMEKRSDGTFTSADARVDLVVSDRKYIKPADGKYWAVNPGAENLPNLPFQYDGDTPVEKLTRSQRIEIQRTMAGYYLPLVENNTTNHIISYYGAKYAYVSTGKPVTPGFVHDRHVRKDINLMKDVPLIGGMDIGGGTLNPAAVFGQVHPRGTKIILGELMEEDCGLERFSIMIKAYIAQKFDNCPVDRIFGDPAGFQRDAIYERTAFEHFEARGIPVQPAWDNNDIKTRIQAARAPMEREIDGTPGLLIHASCERLIAALDGGWEFKRLPGIEPRYMDIPLKNSHSHPADAYGYMMLGSGEAGALTRPKHIERLSKPTVAKSTFKVFG